MKGSQEIVVFFFVKNWRFKNTIKPCTWFCFIDKKFIYCTHHIKILAVRLFLWRLDGKLFFFPLLELSVSYYLPYFLINLIFM